MYWEEELKEHIQSLCDDHKIPDHQAFLLWYLNDTTGKDDKELLNEILTTDKAHDATCDAVLIDDDGQVIRIVQSKYSNNFGQEPFNKDEFAKINILSKYIRGDVEEDKLKKYVHAQLKKKIDKVLLKIKKHGYKSQFEFITPKRNNPNCRLYDPEGMIQIYDYKEIKKKFELWLRGGTPKIGTVELDMHSYMLGPDDPRSFIALLSSKDIREMYIRFQEKLFSSNIRIFYNPEENSGKKKKVNLGMRKTLKECPEYFAYFNNGVTILADKVIINDANKKIILNNPQVINGCQTISTIGISPENDKASLFAKIIETGDALSQELIDGIIEANNRQNLVDERMLRSRHPYQVKLQRQLQPMGYYFECKEGEYKSLKNKLPLFFKNLQRIDNKELLQACLTIKRGPHFAFNNENELFSNHFHDVFKEKKTVYEYLNPYLLLGLIRKTRTEIKKKRYNYIYNYSYFHILKHIYDICDFSDNRKLKSIGTTLSTKQFRDNFDSSPVKRLFAILVDVYKKYGESEGRSPRDFFRLNESYDYFKKRILKQEIRNLQKAFKFE